MRASLPSALLMAFAASCAASAYGGARAASGGAGDASGWIPAADARASPASPAAWQVLGTSHEHRPLSVGQWGSGERTLLVLGPLAGDRTEALQVVDRLALHLGRTAVPPQVRVIVVRDPNPDGRARRRPFNARGVDLDCNFPTSLWRKTPRGTRWSSGEQPQSEPETGALVRLLRRSRPDCVILIAVGTLRASVGCVASGEPLARRAAQAGNLPLWRFDAAAYPGSCPTYAGHDLGLPVVLLMCRPRASAEENWQALQKPLMALLELPVSEPADSVLTGAEVPQPGGELGRATADVSASTDVSNPAAELSGAAATWPGGTSFDGSVASGHGVASLSATSAAGTARRAAAASGADVALAGAGEPTAAEQPEPESAQNSEPFPHGGRDGVPDSGGVDHAAGNVRPQHVRYLLPFTAAARQARQARLQKLYHQASARRLAGTAGTADSDEEALLVPVVRPRGTHGRLERDSPTYQARDLPVLAKPLIERFPPVLPQRPADTPRATALAWSAGGTAPQAYPCTGYPE
jgi:hypothetical protein